MNRATRFVSATCHAVNGIQFRRIWAEKGICIIMICKFQLFKLWIPIVSKESACFIKSIYHWFWRTFFFEYHVFQRFFFNLFDGLSLRCDCSRNQFLNLFNWLIRRHHLKKKYTKHVFFSSKMMQISVREGGNQFDLFKCHVIPKSLMRQSYCQQRQ